jgi:hypothetical protein
MLGRFFRLALVRYAGGPARAALYLSGLSALQRTLRPKPTIESVRVRPGQRYVVEHLTISHKDQIKQLKREEQDAKRARKAARKAGRRTAS